MPAQKKPNSISVGAARTTNEVIQDHLRLRREGRLDEDLENNYAEDTALLTVNSDCSGRDAIRLSARRLAEQLPEASFEYRSCKVRGPYALLIWRGISARNEAVDGADSFVVEDGRIVFQSIHYRLVPEER